MTDKPDAVVRARRVASNPSNATLTDAYQLANALLSSSKRIEELEGALREIACFDDKPANAHLATYGTFGGFDEPGSVEIARAALSPSNGEGEMAQPQTASRSPASERSAK